MIWWGNQYPDKSRLTLFGANAMPELLGIEFVDIGPDWISSGDCTAAPRLL
jgi:hypothetical protein